MYPSSSSTPSPSKELNPPSSDTNERFTLYGHYPDPEELSIILDKLLFWISGWVTYIEDHPREVDVEDFKTAILGKVVGVHPFMAGNKRTARFLAEMITAKLNATTYVYDFVQKNMRRHEYSYYFTRYCWLRDYGKLKLLHEGVRARPPKSSQAQLDDELRVVSNFFFHM
jgi:hypothetical protein